MHTHVHTGYWHSVIYTSMQIHKYHNTYVIEWDDGSYTVVSEDSIDDSDLELVEILATLQQDDEA